jgi:hypothetical protein
MSDANWDQEYSLASDLKDEIIEFCKNHNIECPKFREYIRSWELKPIFKGLKEKYGKGDKNNGI